MNIWLWVEEAVEELEDAGHTRLAAILEEVPRAVTDGEDALAEALIEEGLSLARGLKHAWIEVFLRHWRLQSRVRNRSEARGNLPECVSLLEFATRPETEKCPQAVCVTQDLTSCYERLDAPGYAAERLEASRQALERIDPSWPCFECISSEHADALYDTGDPAAALAFVDEQRRKHARKPGEKSSILSSDAAIACYALGEFERQLQEVERWDVSLSGAGGAIARDTHLSRARFALGQLERGLETLPRAEQVEAAMYVFWTETVLLAVRRGAIAADGDLSLQVARMAGELEDRGSVWDAACAQLDALELAVRRGKPGLALALERSVRRLIPALRKPERIEPRFAALRREREPLALAPIPAEDEAAFLGAVPEELWDAFEWAVAGAERWPESADVAALLVRALSAVELRADAVATARAFLARHRGAGADAIVDALASLLLVAGRFDELEQLCAELPPGSIQRERTVARMHRARRRHDEAAACFERVLAQDPGDAWARALLARTECARGNWAAALAHCDHLIVDGEATAAVHWDRIVAATVLGRWDIVRESSTRLGTEIEGEGPIDDNFGLCRIRVRGEREDRDLEACRTGPVTARILEISAPGHPQHYSDLVVFDPTPVGPDPEEEDEPPTFSLLQVLEPGAHRCFSLEGVYPGSDALDALARRAGCPLHVRSGEQYELAPEGSERVRGLYAFLGVPESADLREVHRALAEVKRELDLDLAWIGLVSTIGDPALVAEHQSVLDRLQITPD